MLFLLQPHDRIVIIIKVQENSGDRAFSQIPHKSAEEERRETSIRLEQDADDARKTWESDGGKQAHY